VASQATSARNVSVACTGDAVEVDTTVAWGHRLSFRTRLYPFDVLLP